MELLILFLFILSFAVVLLLELRKQRIKDRQPTYSYRATVRGKRPGQYLRNGKLCPGNLHSCVVTFELSAGSLIDLNTVGADSGHPVGTTGTVIFQGEKCERFDPDK